MNAGWHDGHLSASSRLTPSDKSENDALENAVALTKLSRSIDDVDALPHRTQAARTRPRDTVGEAIAPHQMTPGTKMYGTAFL